MGSLRVGSWVFRCEKSEFHLRDCRMTVRDGGAQAMQLRHADLESIVRLFNGLRMGEERRTEEWWS
jgi:hypothetical protein